MTDATMARPTRRVDLWFAGPSPQNRWSVGFRIILAIPQLVVLFFLGIAVFFVVVVGWFAALFTGRLPEWAHLFVTGVVRWNARVGAYLFLLTDRYPPFSLDDEAYPVRPFMPRPGSLNRWAVLFRFVLAFPAGVFYQIVQYGLTTPLLLAMWVVVLVSGTMPGPLYDCYAALLRYQTRFYAWFTMLTSEYAWGMLGDRVAPVPAPGAPPPYAAPPPFAPATPPAPPAPPPAASYAPPPATPQPYAYPRAEPAGSGERTPQAAPEPAPGWPPPAPSAPPSPAPPAAPPPPPIDGGPGAMPPPPARERVTPGPPGGGAVLPPWGTLVLEGAARGWMIAAIVWGSIVFVGQDVTRNIVVGNTHHHSSGQYLGAHRGPAASARGRPGAA